MSSASRVAAPARLHVPFAQVEQVTARLDFARLPDVRRFDAEALERIAADDHLVVGEDRAELERERVQRAAELLRGEKKRRRQAGIVPRGHALGARPQVVGRQGIDDGQRRRRVAPACRAIRDQRLQTRTEDVAQVALERRYAVGNVHTMILAAFGARSQSNSSR